MNLPISSLPLRNCTFPASTKTRRCLLTASRSLLGVIATALLFLALPWAGAAGEGALSGTFSVGGKAAALKHAGAYKGEPESGKPVTVLIFSAKAPGKSAKPASGALFGEFGDAIVVKVFEDGKIYSAELLHSGFNLPNNTLTLLGNGEVGMKDFKNADGAISGTLTSDGAKDARGQKWEVALKFSTAQNPAAPSGGGAKLDAPVKPTVGGKFVGNGKNAAIQFVLVEEREAFSDKEAIRLIFTEKDPATVKKPSWDASFGKLGSSLVVSVFYDGGIFGCEVGHSAHQKRGFSAIGEIKMAEFKIAGGNVTGHLVTGKELDAFGEKWEVDLTFAAPLPEKLRNAPASVPKPVAGEPGEATKKPKKEKNEPKVADGPLIAARRLALPKDATDVEFKALVKHIQFSSPQSVEAVAKEFSANLKQQGWNDGKGSLMGKKNAILHREQGGAKLTIMIQPAAAGSVVKIFTEGLDWSGGDAAGTSAPKKTTTGAADDAETQVQKALKDAQKALQDALKDVPKL